MKYYNLTQAKGRRMVYFRSTDVEQKNYRRLLWSVPDELLYYLSKGKKITIVDKSTKDRNKIERIFIPVLNDVLNWLYFGYSPINNKLKYHYNRAIKTIEKDNQLKTKFEFWSKSSRRIYLLGRIKIQAKTIKVKHELRQILSNTNVLK